MAAVSLSPAPISSFPSTMSTRRAPLSSNPNAANSPIRTRPTASLASVLDKHRQQTSKRAHASVQRDEPYGQQPPNKKLLLNDGSKEAVRSPPPVRQVKIVRKDHSKAQKSYVHTANSAVLSRSAQQEDEVIRMRRWKESTRENFPAYVFYFENVADDKRVKLVKQIAQLGGREEKFFSKDITHVITTRSLPLDRPNRVQSENASGPTQTHGVQAQQQSDMPKTIDPSLLSRDPNVKDVRRRLLESGRKRVPVQAAETSALRQPTAARSTDILVRAHEMKKKIWHVTKLQHIFEAMLGPESLPNNGNDLRATGKAEKTSLAQLLNKERVNGPSDRDPTVSSKELLYFKGPYIYVHDIEEKQKPIMVREYAKVAEKVAGDWPQFRAAKDGRCPFVEEDPYERQRREEKAAHDKERERRRQRALAQRAAPEVKAPPLGRPIGKPVRVMALAESLSEETGDRVVKPMKRSLAELISEEPGDRVGKPVKRSLAELISEEPGDRVGGPARASEMFDLAKATKPPNLDFNAFASRARPGRLFGGEPVASGIQRSNITSAVQSQMISSATGVLGAKAGTSREVHGLQRKVLQKGSLTSANPTSQDMSSRRLADMSLDTATFQRSASLGLGSRRLGQIAEDKVKDHKRTVSVPSNIQAKPKKRELKPGYCENCQDKFDDFEEHVLTKKHRKFAEDLRNWTQLDDLLSQLERVPKYVDVDDDDGSVGSVGSSTY